MILLVSRFLVTTFLSLYKITLFVSSHQIYKSANAIKTINECMTQVKRTLSADQSHWDDNRWVESRLDGSRWVESRLDRSHRDVSRQDTSRRDGS
jgi:hypothetical protein